MNKYVIALSLFAVCASQSAHARCANGQCGLPDQDTTQQTQYYNQQQNQQQQYQPQYQQQQYQPQYQTQPTYNPEQQYYPQQQQQRSNCANGQCNRGQVPVYVNPDFDKTIPEHDFTWGHRDRPYYYNQEPKYQTK